MAAFEAAARHQSFTLAADELALTQSAVGRQIANLEDFLGVKLFRRTRRGVVLTPPGLQYSRMVRARLDDVERDTLHLLSCGGGGGSLELGVVPTFATHWLIPRLTGFKQLHPGIHLHLHARTRPFLFEESGLDAAIYAGVGGWPGTHAERLMPEPMVVVCAPALAGRRKRLKAADLAGLPLIQMTTRPYAWREWFRAQGMEFEGDMAGPRMELFSMATQAAIHGLGVALVPEIFVQEELRRDVLVAPFDHAALSGFGYYLIHPEAQADHPELSLFRKWILSEASSYLGNVESAEGC
ncbi:MAG: LysR family transcriptional regulator [Ramlibacter sp.]|nr:LysR family transcriptional regulator [Ramlibacter sp.]